MNGDDEPAAKPSRKKEQRKKEEPSKRENESSMLLDRVGEGGLDGVIGVGTSRESLPFGDRVLTIRPHRSSRSGARA